MGILLNKEALHVVYCAKNGRLIRDVTLWLGLDDLPILGGDLGQFLRPPTQHALRHVEFMRCLIQRHTAIHHPPRRLILELTVNVPFVISIFLVTISSLELPWKNRDHQLIK
jgi:hypothetical protein